MLITNIHLDYTQIHVYIYFCMYIPIPNFKLSLFNGEWTSGGEGGLTHENLQKESKTDTRTLVLPPPSLTPPPPLRREQVHAHVCVINTSAVCMATMRYPELINSENLNKKKVNNATPGSVRLFMHSETGSSPVLLRQKWNKLMSTGERNTPSGSKLRAHGGRVLVHRSLRFS